MDKEIAERAEKLIEATLHDKSTLYATNVVMHMALGRAKGALSEAGLDEKVAEVEAIERCETDEARNVYLMALAYGPVMKVKALVP